MGSLGSTAASIQANYMKLLVTQLQNQNPLEPMDNNQMATQLAQLSQLEQSQIMNSTFSKVLTSQQLTEANGMIGRQVSYLPDNATDPVWITVDGAAVTNGQVTVKSGTTSVNIENVLEIKN